MEVVKEAFYEVKFVLTQKGGAGIIHEDERTKNALGRMLSYTKSQRQSRMHFRNFIYFSNEERVKTGDKVGFYHEDHRDSLFLHSSVII